jgi:hypothetical protein
MWEEVKFFLSEGKIDDATILANDVKEDAVEAMKILEMQVPEAQTK